MFETTPASLETTTTQRKTLFNLIPFDDLADLTDDLEEDDVQTTKANTIPAGSPTSLLSLIPLQRNPGEILFLPLKIALDLP